MGEGGGVIRHHSLQEQTLSVLRDEDQRTLSAKSFEELRKV